MVLESGSSLGPYEILSLLGTGGMGEVYRARDPRIGRSVAIKILAPALAQDRERLLRFQQEIRAVGALNHPSVVSVYDVGEDRGLPYLVTEMLSGETLRERLYRGPLSARRAADCAAQIAEGLAAAHEKGIVHRDLKPENVFVCDDERVKILDFGVAKLTPPEAELERGATALTHSGAVIGTVGYMSPEQVRGEPADERSDLFAFGAILYEMLTGARAFKRATGIASLHAILEDEPPVVPSLPPAIASLIAHCLQKDPHRRFQSARDLALTLRTVAIQSSPSLWVGGWRLPRPSGRSGRALLGMLAVAALAAAIALWVRRSPARSEPPVLRHLTFSSNDYAPAASPDRRSVAFVSHRDGLPRIWLKDLLSGSELALTAGPDLFPRFAPDGSSLLYVHFEGPRGALTKIPFPGGEPRVLLQDVYDADWSPDGRRVVFVRHLSQDGDSTSVVAILDVGSGAVRDLARIEHRILYQPRWSPDGSLVALVEAGGEEVLLVSVAEGTLRSLAPPAPPRDLSTASWDGPEHVVYLRAQEPMPGIAVSAGACLRQNVRSKSIETLFWTPNWGQHLDVFADGRIVFAAGSRARTCGKPS